jgi:hypothetical protein
MIAFATASNQDSFLVLTYGIVSLTPSNNLKVERCSFFSVDLADVIVTYLGLEVINKTLDFNLQC